ncbi:hypothetical protein [Sodalis sp. RH22]|uniref:hypothetical protein n=1 Tax=unclassified Sodalis (in: enterobacteria) TaxID=2636512 RepID=UPI0039B64F1F
MPSNPLLDTNNLSDVANIATARENLDVDSRDEAQARIDEFSTILAASDGAKLVGRCADVATLRTLVPSESGQQIALLSYYPLWETNKTSPAGGGSLTALANTDLVDDGGRVFRVNTHWVWLRDETERSLTAYDFGAHGQGTSYDDTSAVQNWLNYAAASGGASISIGNRGSFNITSQLELNRSAGSNLLGKCLDFSGTRLLVNYGTVIGNWTSFGDWTLTGATVVNDTTNNLLAFSSDGLSSQGKASISLTGLTVGQIYTVQVEVQTWTTAQETTIGIYWNGATIIRRPDAGVGVYLAEIEATATSGTLQIQQNDGQAIFSVSRVDVRLAAFGLRVYQTGTNSIHQFINIRGARFEAVNTACLGGIRLDDINDGVFEYCKYVGFTNGPAILHDNLTNWSENNFHLKPEFVNCKYGFRFSRPVRGTTDLSSFARMTVIDPFIAGVEYFSYMDKGTAVYDSEFGTVCGNITAVTKAIYHLSGDQTGTILQGTRAEVNATHPDGFGMVEYGYLDLRRAAFLLSTPKTGGFRRIKGFTAGTVWRPIYHDGGDFSNSPVWLKKINWRPDTTQSLFPIEQEWSEIILGVVAETTSTVNNAGTLSVTHGIVQLDISLRTSGGDTLQGSRLSIILAKGSATSSTPTTNTLIAVTAGSEVIAVSWAGGSSPTISFSGSTNTRSFAIKARWVQ